MFQFAKFVVVFIGFLGSPILSANEPAYCGIYAVYGAARAEAMTNLDFKELISPEYVSSRQGSTIPDLIKAGQKLGLSVFVIHRASSLTLSVAEKPLVLHTAIGGQFAQFNHWELFLGWENGRARMVQADGTVSLVEPSVLLGRWDGMALSFSNGSTTFERVRIYAVEWLARLMFGLVVLVLGHRLISFKSLQQQSGRLKLAWLALCITTIICASIFVLPGSSHASRSSIARSFEPYTPLRVSIETTTDFSDFKLIDARFERNFRQEHLLNAMSLPVDCSDSEITDFANKLSVEDRVLLYCHSERCGYDDAIARRLFVAGVKNVYVLDQGFVEWKLANLPTSH